MRVLLASHGYPPELEGGTENSVRALARGLAGAGHEVRVVAGSLRPGAGRVELTRDQDGPVEVVRLHRPDLHFDHWHKGRSPDLAERFREQCREFEPDVCHVHHWIRLSTDLVASAAREGVPAVVTLHDFWSSCPLVFRVRPDTRAACEVPAGPLPCVACAAQVPPRTPWVPEDAGFVRLVERQQEIERELRLARVVSAPSRAHAEAIERYLSVAPGRLAVRVVPPAREPLVLPVEARSLAGAPLAGLAPLDPPGELGRLVVGAWGHLVPHKGADLLLEAVGLARVEVELHLAGSAPDAAFEAALRERARGLPVTFHGPYTPAELPGHPATRVHALVSGARAAESYGLVCDEARDLGLPSLVPAAGAFPERVGAGAALYTPGDAAALARLFERLVGEPELLETLRGELDGQVVGAAGSPAGSVRAWLELYGLARERGAPELAEEEWFEARMRRHALEQWDRDLGASGGPA